MTALFRCRLTVHDIGFPIQIDTRHVEIVKRTEVLLHPKPNLNNSGP